MTRYISVLTIMFITQTIKRESKTKLSTLIHWSLEFLKALEIETS